MKERVDPERSHDFKRTVLLAASLALLLALLILGFYYGCAKASRPEHPSTPPPASGMSAALHSGATHTTAAIRNFVSQPQFAELT
jgi:hypothetical protein